MQPVSRRVNSRKSIGLLLIIAGILLLAYKMGAPLPGWLFTWPVATIAVGLLMGLRSNFKNNIWIILIFIGAINLADMMFPSLRFDNYIAPAIIIVLGLVFILRPSQSWRRERSLSDNNYGNENKQHHESEADYINDGAEYLESVAVFGGIKKMILSKNFKGGEITCFMGGAEINLVQADIQREVVIEATQVFGGTKIIVPPHWHVKSEVVAIFGGIDDKRPVQAGNVNPEKTLILRGTSVFGGIDIRSYY